MKEIDWEERHFRICLALIQGQATKPATPSFPYTTIIKQADRMVEILKKQAVATDVSGEEQTTKPQSTAEEVKPGETDKKKFVGFLKSAKMKQIWNALEKLGYAKGCDIPYFHFNECCEELNIDANSIDIEAFQERFDVKIG